MSIVEIINGVPRVKEAVVFLTDDQREILMPYFEYAGEHGCSLMAQVYPDGMRVIPIPNHMVKQIGKITGVKQTDKVRGLATDEPYIPRPKKQKPKLTVVK